MSDIASIAAEEFSQKYDPATMQRKREIKINPQAYLEHTIPYLTVRALHRLEADSKWIKAFAIITGILTFVLVGLTIVLAKYASRLDAVITTLTRHV